MQGTSLVSNFPFSVLAVGKTAFMVAWMRGMAVRPVVGLMVRERKDKVRERKWGREGGKDEVRDRQRSKVECIGRVEGKVVEMKTSRTRDEIG
jgi:hypothetical protein